MTDFEAGNLREGDIVMLNSGGPLMTVEKVWIDMKWYASCIWFDGSKGGLDSAEFGTNCLMREERRSQ
jgi:uncharacterized protein YodC (DUF2158 family)